VEYNQQTIVNLKIGDVVAVQVPCIVFMQDDANEDYSQIEPAADFFAPPRGITSMESIQMYRLQSFNANETVECYLVLVLTSLYCNFVTCNCIMLIVILTSPFYL